MREYWNDPERTAEVMIADDEGKMWMYTGDEAEMDEEGYVRITGRIKDIIIRGGENIHPLEVWQSRSPSVSTIWCREMVWAYDRLYSKSSRG